MTWSIVARDPASGAFGIAVTTKFFAVGALCPHGMSGVGALATQALINPTFGPNGLRLLAEGRPASAVMETLLAGDQGREMRQLHVLDAMGGNAAHTGRGCIDWCGHSQRREFSVAGNMLTGPRVIEDTASSYEMTAHLPFAERLIGALDAGQAAGGDKRGKQSAALLIQDQEDYPLYDLRVDDHPDPLAELARLEAIARERWVHFRRHMPGRRTFSDLIDRDHLDLLIASSITEGYE